MDRKKELLEARDALHRVLEEILDVKKELKSAKNLGLWDIFGGSTFVSFIKRNKLKKANQAMDDLEYRLQQAQKELQDVQMNLSNTVTDSNLDFLFDVFFDNIFTDLRVQGQIRDVINKLDDLEVAIQGHLNKVEAELGKNF